MLRYLPLLLLLTSCTLSDQRVSNTLGDALEVKNVEFFIDQGGELAFEDIQNNREFQPYTEPELNFGHLREPVWIKVELENKSDQPQELYLSSDQFILEDVRFWHQEDSVWLQENSGWGRPIKDRQMPTYLHSFEFSLAPQTVSTVYFRVKNEYQVLRLPLTLYDRQGFYRHHNSSLIEDGLVILALITSILFSIYNLVFTAEYRKTLVLYLVYAVNFLLFYTLRVASPAFISQPFPIELNYLINICIFISTYTFLRFAVSFVNINKRPENKFLVTAIDVLFGATVLVSLFPSQEGNQFFFIIKLAFFVFNILYLIWYLLNSLKENVLARLYIIMAMPLVLSGLIEGLTNVFGVIKIPNQFFEAFRLSICLEMLFILFALIYRERFLSKIVEQKLKDTELQLANAYIEIQETEQKRIARDLHDDLGGTLSTLKRKVFDKLLHLTSDEDQLELTQLAQRAGDDLRRISHALMPPNFERTGLVDSIRELIKFNKGPGRNFKFGEHGNRVELPAKSALHVYRIFSEILQNINKHSNATEVHVQLVWSAEELSLIVEDDGSQFVDNEEGLGMKNMRMRADYLNGKLNFDSNKSGSTIILDVPLQ
ncbi:7TM-DISM domain-containing protein [Jiulongibacter sediminis]|uniref:sensor histidine kinase n=1 Tax=Jiulongibacter sediminis TaxID=1605367 RepID=UPI0026F12823|nr:7TM-DISM domain-containing protein [Jiulongibacter sediminis]